MYQLDNWVWNSRGVGASKLKTPDGKWTGRRGKGKRELQLEVRAAFGYRKKRERSGRRLPPWSRRDRGRDTDGGEFAGTRPWNAHPWSLGRAGKLDIVCWLSLPPTVSMTEDLADVVWLEKATLSFCTKMEEVIEDTGNSAYHRGSTWHRPEKVLCSAPWREAGLESQLHKFP